MLSVVWALLFWGSMAAGVLLVLGRFWAGPPARPGTEARARLDDELTAVDAEIERLRYRK